MNSINVCNKKFWANSDSIMIQRAIDYAEKNGINSISIPRINSRTKKHYYLIDTTILLPSKMTVYLYDCHLILADGVYENIFRNKNLYTDIGLTKEGEQNNINLLGFGNAVLDGGKDNGLREQNWTEDKPNPRTNCLILLCNVRDYTIKGITCKNLRYWAINQIACSKGHISDINFDCPEWRPNQDGINLRLGCSEIIIENITGHTGDDVVALSAFGLGWDKPLLPKGYSPDISNVIIRNVCAHTFTTVVALRNNDGAKIHDVTIENITDNGADDCGPWGVVRLGENNWYKKRPAILGELSNITVRNVRSFSHGTVYLSSALKNSHISDVFATGKTVYAISTYQSKQVFWETGCDILPGVTMENVCIDNIYYSGTSEYQDNPNDTYAQLTYPNENFKGCAIDFRAMRKDDYFNNVIIRNVFCRENCSKILLGENKNLKIILE